MIHNYLLNNNGMRMCYLFSAFHYNVENMKHTYLLANHNCHNKNISDTHTSWPIIIVTIRICSFLFNLSAIVHKNVTNHCHKCYHLSYIHILYIIIIINYIYMYKNKEYSMLESVVCTKKGEKGLL